MSLNVTVVFLCRTVEAVQGEVLDERLYRN